jgi:truncated hemoglobin YjbI
LDGAVPPQPRLDASAARRLAEVFYSGVDRYPLLRPFFPGKTRTCAIEEFTAFLAQIFEDPAADTQRRWWLSLRESHLRFRIERKERAAWMENMVRALDQAGIEEPLRGALREFFERSSAYVINTGEPLAVEDPALPPGDTLRQGIAVRWEAQRGLDRAVAAVREGDADRAIALAETLTTQYRRLSVSTGLLGLMMGSRNPAMLHYVEERITSDPALLRERFAGLTLLHQACAQGNRAMVEFLLRLGADPNAQDGGGHTPLYSLANEYRASNGGEIVRILSHGGANVNAADGVKRCTALHMAARRGSLEIAVALLDCGADIEARDSVGETPLRRAVNCNKIQVAALLIEKGANAHSKGSKSLTPFLAARTTQMKNLLQTPQQKGRQ